MYKAPFPKLEKGLRGTVQFKIMRVHGDLDRPPRDTSVFWGGRGRTRRPGGPDLTFYCHSLVTNEQHRSSNESNKWLQGCVFSDGNYRKEIRSTELKLRAFLVKFTVQNWPGWLQSVLRKLSVFLVLINQSLFLTRPAYLSNYFKKTSVKSRMAAQPGLHFSSPFYGGD